MELVLYEVGEAQLTRDCESIEASVSSDREVISGEVLVGGKLVEKNKWDTKDIYSSLTLVLVSIQLKMIITKSVGQIENDPFTTRSIQFWSCWHMIAVWENKIEVSSLV